MIKQNAGFKHKIDRAAVEELFKPCPVCAALPLLEVAIGRPEGCTCPEQGELLTRLYRLAVPDFDRLEKLDGYPVVNRETGDFLMLRWVRRDRRLSPNVMAGGAWMNSGFSSREQTEVTGKLEDFEVWLPAAMVLNVAPAITIVPEPLNHAPHIMETENGKVTKVTIGHAGSDGLSQPPEARTDSGHAHLAPDRLRELFRMQRLLNQRIGVNTDAMSEEEQIKWLLQYSRCTQQELAELVDSVPWKHWSKYQKYDKQNARVEVVDMFHFLISMAQVLGMSADDLFDAYLKKNAVNFQRQESGYTQKDHGDSKHI